MTVPSLVIITTGPFDGVAWNVVVALMLFTTGEDASAALAWLGMHIAPDAKAIENKNFFMFSPF